MVLGLPAVVGLLVACRVYLTRVRIGAAVVDFVLTGGNHGQGVRGLPCGIEVQGGELGYPCRPHGPVLQ